MQKNKILEKLDKYLERCDYALKEQKGDSFYGSYVPAPIFNVLKTSVISFLNQLRIDTVFCDSISQLNDQTPDDVNTIRNYILEVKDLIQNDTLDSLSLPLFKEYDVFLSHASKDKASFVNALKIELEKLGVNVFYDEESIEWGDNWEDCINKALDQCEFAIVVLSKNFFGREWTEKELKSLLDRKNALGQKLILPIFHNTSLRTIRKKYPQVAAIQAIASENKSVKDIAILFAGQLIGRLKEKKLES